MSEALEIWRPGKGSHRQKLLDRRRARDRAELEQFDRRYARFRVHLLEAERTRRSALAAIAERDALRARRLALRWGGALAAVASVAGAVCDPFGPLPDEPPNDFRRRVDAETPRLTLADFERPSAWWNEETESAVTADLLRAAWTPLRKLNRKWGER